MKKSHEPLEFLREFSSLHPEREALIGYIEKYTSLIFSEEITWLKNKEATADLEGKDSDDNIVIVEVKIWSTNPSERRSQEYSAIGQIIHHGNVHSTKYSTDSIRLFVVGSVKAPNVEPACKLLRANGVNIYYIDVSEVVDSAHKELTAIQDMLYAF